MKRKHIVFSSYDSPDNPYYGGGGGRAISEVAMRLARRFDITVLSAAYPGAQNGRINGVAYRYVGNAGLGPKTGQLAFSALLPFIARSMSFDIWFENLTPPFGFSMLPLAIRRRVIGLAHMIPGADMRRKYLLPFDRLESLGLRLYNRFVVTTKHAQDYIRYINSKADITIIPNGVPYPQNLRKKYGRYIGYIGRLELNQKGIDLLLSSYARIRNTTSLPLHIACTASPRERLKLIKHIVLRGLVRHVRVIGPVEGEQKRQFFQNAACIVVPSRFETYSLVALETLSYGIPLVTFDIDGLRWIPRDTRLTARPFDIEDLAQEIRRACTDSSVRNGLFTRGRNYAKDHTWESVSRKYNGYIQTLL